MAAKKEAEVMTAPLEGEILEPFVVTIISATPRRRAGHSFGPVPKHLTRDDLYEKLDDGRTVIEAIEADPLLVVRAYKPEPQPEAEAPQE